MPLTYSNPRMHAEIKDWPMGGARRGVATFSVETQSRGQRATRTTRVNGKTQQSKPKLGTYARKVRIVDGSDNRTYFMQLAHHSSIITILNGNMEYDHEVIYSSDPRHAELLALFEAPTTG